MQTVIDRAPRTKQFREAGGSTRAIPRFVGKSQAEEVVRMQFHEAVGAQAVADEMAVLQREHSAWMYQFEDADPGTAAAQDVIELLLSAPNAFAKGLVYGMFRQRVDLAAITGRTF